MNPQILICECGSREHQIVIEYDEDDNILYCHIHLVKRGFFRRLWPGLRYIFGYKCKYGHWDEFIFNPQHIESLKNAIELLGPKCSKCGKREIFSDSDLCQDCILDVYDKFNPSPKQ